MKKAVKAAVFTALTTLALTAFASAEGEIAISAGCTTGTSLRLRSEPNTSASIVTTLNKSMAVALLDTSTPGWYKVDYNGNTGYVSSDYIAIDQDNLFTSYGRVPEGTVHVRAGASTDSASLATISAGTIVTVNGLVNGWYDVTCQYGTEGYIRSDLLVLTSNPTSSKGSSIVETAMKHLGTRYVYGGASAGGFDCSGFTMYIYKQFGYNLPHSATSQWLSGMGTKIYSISELQPGDLVFFNDPSRNAGKACSHAGIYIGNGQHIHASSSRGGGVIISDMTSGYYNTYFVGGLRLSCPSGSIFYPAHDCVPGFSVFRAESPLLLRIFCKSLRNFKGSPIKKLAFSETVCYIHTSVKNVMKEAIPCLMASIFWIRGKTGSLAPPGWATAVRS